MTAYVTSCLKQILWECNTSNLKPTSAAQIQNDKNLTTNVAVHVVCNYQPQKTETKANALKILKYILFCLTNNPNIQLSFPSLSQEN